MWFTVYGLQFTVKIIWIIFVFYKFRKPKMVSIKKILSYSIFSICLLLLPVMIYCYQWSASNNKLEWRLFGYDLMTVLTYFDLLFNVINILLLGFLITTIILRVKPIMWFTILLIIIDYILLNEIDPRPW
jgi:hypothetical protein